MNRKVVSEVLEFLLKTGLVHEKQGRLEIGTLKTYLPADSLLVARHHTNWRLKAIENFAKLDANELAFTSPLTISKSDFPKVKSLLLKVIEDITKIVEKSESEDLACLNLDWFIVLK